MNIKNAKTMIKTLYKRQIETGVRYSVMLQSGPGLGKSESVAQAVAELSQELKQPFGLKTFLLSTVESPDLRGFGIPAKDTDGTPIMTYTRAPWGLRAGDPQHGILFLDEFRQASHDVQKPAAELLLNGRVGETSLPLTYMVVAASNRDTDRSGVQREMAFITNRLLTVDVHADLDAWAEWAEKSKVHWMAVAFAKANPSDVFADRVPDKPGPFCTPRTLVKVANLIDAGMPQSMFSEAAAGLIGEGTATKLVAFMRVIDELPTFEEIVKDPETCRLPPASRPDAQYAAMQMVAHRVTPATSRAVFTYLLRLPREFQFAGLRAALRVAPQVLHNKEFADWMRSNSQLLAAVAAAS
jgi:hypothetical protein